MITLEKLRAYGANTEEGLARCMNNEAFYLRLVGMEMGDRNIEGLKAALKAGDARAAFEAAHAIKGATGNLGLTPVFDPVSELTEKMRAEGGAAEAGDLARRVFEAFDALQAIADDPE